MNRSPQETGEGQKEAIVNSGIPEVPKAPDRETAAPEAGVIPRHNRGPGAMPSGRAVPLPPLTPGARMAQPPERDPGTEYASPEEPRATRAATHPRRGDFTPSRLGAATEPQISPAEQNSHRQDPDGQEAQRTDEIGKVHSHVQNETGFADPGEAVFGARSDQLTNEEGKPYFAGIPKPPSFTEETAMPVSEPRLINSGEQLRPPPTKVLLSKPDETSADKDFETLRVDGQQVTISSDRLPLDYSSDENAARAITHAEVHFDETPYSYDFFTPSEQTLVGGEDLTRPVVITKTRISDTNSETEVLGERTGANAHHYDRLQGLFNSLQIESQEAVESTNRQEIKTLLDALINDKKDDPEMPTRVPMRDAEPSMLQSTPGNHNEISLTSEQQDGPKVRHPVNSVINGVANGITTIESRYLMRHPIGNDAIRRGAKTVLWTMPVATVEGVGMGISHLASSGVAQTVFTANLEGVTAPIAAYGAFKVGEGIVRRYHLQELKRRRARRKMAKEDQNASRRQEASDRLDQEAVAVSLQLKNEAADSPDRTIPVRVLVIGDGPHGIEVKSVIHEKKGRKYRDKKIWRKKKVDEPRLVVSVDSNDWLGGEFGGDKLAFRLNTSTGAAQLQAGTNNLPRRLISSGKIKTYNRNGVVLDFIRNTDDRGKGVTIDQRRHPSDAGSMSPSHLSDFATSSNPLSTDKGHEAKRNSRYAGPTMLGVTVTEIVDTDGGFFVSAVDNNTREEFRFRAEKVVDATGQGKERDDIQGSHIQTSTAFRENPVPVLEAVEKGQAIGIFGGRDSGYIAIEGVRDLVEAERNELIEHGRSLTVTPKDGQEDSPALDSSEIAHMLRRLNNVVIHLYDAKFATLEEFKMQTTNRYKYLADYMQVARKKPIKSNIKVYPHQGYIAPHKDHSYVLQRNEEGLPVIDNQEFGAVITAMGRVPSTILYNGRPLSDQTEHIKGMHGLVIGEQVPGREIYVVGSRADMPLRAEDPDQFLVLKAIKRRTPRLMPEDIFITSHWRQRWPHSLDRRIPRSTQVGIQISVKLDSPVLLRAFNRLRNHQVTASEEDAA